jgi:hypothetical protein
MDAEPFGKGQVKAIILRCLDGDGHLRFSPHALEEMANDGLGFAEAEAVLRGGMVEGHDLISGTWRYRLRRVKTYVVVVFDTETMTVVVTAWRKK